jgi:aspartate kinase
VSVTIDDPHPDLRNRLSKIADVETIDDQCIVAVVGENLMADARTGARVLDALHGIAVKMMSLGRSGLNLSIVVDDRDADRAVQSIHNALFENPVLLKREDAEGSVDSGEASTRDGSFAVFAAQDDRKR